MTDFIEATREDARIHLRKLAEMAASDLFDMLWPDSAKGGAGGGLQAIRSQC